MINTAVTVANVKTMADRSVRVTIDLLPGTPAEFAEAFRLMSQDCYLYLGDVEEFNLDGGEPD